MVLSLKLIYSIVEAQITEDKKVMIIEAHKTFAAGLFNKTWELYDKKDRTRLEDEEMLYAAHASAYHWSRLEDAVDEDWSTAKSTA